MISNLFQDVRSSLVDALRKADEALIFDQGKSPAKEIERHIITLTDARDRKAPLIIPYPFKCVYIEDASDSSANVRLIPHTQNEFQSEIKLTKKDSFRLKEVINGCALYWSAQAGKTITIVLIRNGDIISGSLNADIINTVSSTILQSMAPVDVTDTATIIRASNSRTNLIIQNLSVNPVFIGDNTVTDALGVKVGTRLAQYDIYIHNNTAAIYGIRGAGLSGDVSVNEERLA